MNKCLLFLTVLAASTMPVLAQQSPPLDTTTWTQTSASSANWHAIASSADGSRLIAAQEFGGVYLSANAGVSWNRTTSGLPTGSSGWISAASSANGMFLGLVDLNAGLYLSFNSGANWTLQALPPAVWLTTAASADGQRWVVAANLNNLDTGPGPLYTSPNYGIFWVSNNLPLENWTSVTSSADGQTLAAAARQIPANNITVNNPGPIYTSTNYGANWILANLPTQIWSSIACSADGSKLMAVALNGPVYASTNFGTVWTPASSPVTTNWLSIAASADGTKFTGEVFGGNIYTTTNLGDSWMLDNAPSNNWAAITLSADGNKMASVIYGGGIYTAQLTPAPQLKLFSTNGTVGLSWIIPSTNFALQQNPTMASASWSAVTNTPMLNLTNLQNQVTLPVSPGNMFYRLKTP